MTSALNRKAKLIVKTLLRPLIEPRRFQAYCVGTPKSGTHSIAALFSPHYRACHEPEFLELWNKLFTVQDGLISERELVRYVRARDKRLWLELDSSNLNFFLIDILVQESMIDC